MKKYTTCFNCDAEFKVSWPEGNEDTFGVPCYCPFCGVDLETELKFEEEELDEDEE